MNWIGPATILIGLLWTLVNLLEILAERRNERLRISNISPPFAKRIIRLDAAPQIAKVKQMPVVESPKSLGPHYTKSLKMLLKGPLGIAEKKDVVRYRALQAMGLVDGVGVRCVSLTKAGRNLLTTGELTPIRADKVESDFQIYLNGTRITNRTALPAEVEFSF